MALEKTFDTGTAEARIYAAWEQAGCFKAGANATRNETFTIMIPPPNVTGVLHMGRLWPLSNENDKPKSPARYLCLTLSPCGREVQGKGLLQNHYIRTNFAVLLHHR